MALRAKRDADSAQIESDEVASVSVLRTGDVTTSMRNTSMDDLIALTPRMSSKRPYHQNRYSRDEMHGLNVLVFFRSESLTSLQSRASHSANPRGYIPMLDQIIVRGFSGSTPFCGPRFRRMKSAMKRNMVERCWVTAQAERTSGRYAYGRTLAGKK